MGILGKLKGIFYDEVLVEDEEVVETPKKEVKEEKPVIEKVNYNTISDLNLNLVDDEEEIEEVVELPKEKKVVSRREERLDNTFSDRELFRNERTFNFTEFDDDEEEILPPKKNVLNNEVRQQPRPVEQPRPVQRETKVFKPSPIISPIYGILDKDYKKEEIIEKKKQPTNTVGTIKVTTYDTVRRKAYGTLEDELEDTLNSFDSKITTDTINSEMNRIEKKAEPKVETTADKIESLINQIEEVSDEIDKSLTIGELENAVELENFEEEPIVEINEENNIEDTITDSSLEHDLFNLIDSMYDKED